ncbi:MAG TPA: hypothetical protein VJH70_01640 [Candidatus Paceibacterota bacterium]
MKPMELLKNRILWKVYAVWFFAKILPILLFELIVIVGALYIFGKFVFVERVVGNTLLIASEHPLALFNFLVFAFMKTSWIIKGVTLIGLSIGALILRDIGRVLVSYRMTSRLAKPKE